MIAGVVLCGAGLAMDDAQGNLLGQQLPIFTILALGILAVALIIPSISVMVRRQHDIGLSGWFYLLVFLPSIGSIILFVFSLIPSQAHDNKWGPVPFGVRVPSPFTPPAPGT